MLRKLYCAALDQILVSSSTPSSHTPSLLLLRRRPLSSSSQRMTSELPTRMDTYGGLHLDVSSLSLDTSIEQTVERELQSRPDSRTVWIRLADKHFEWLHRLSKVLSLR